MRAVPLVAFLALYGCAADPAVLVPSLVDPASATAQYFHGNCFAGFAVHVDFRVRETQGVEVVLSQLEYQLADRGTGQVLLDERLDGRALEDRFGASASLVRAGATRTYPLSGTSGGRPAGPLAVRGEIAGVDENGEPVVASFDLSATLVVTDPGPPAGGACTSD